MIKAHGGADKHITNFWHKPENNIGIPAWERAWSDKFADDMDIIIGSAKENGLDPEEYLGCFLAACDDPNFDLRRDLSDLLPWRLKMAVK
ncbi:MAG: hypothetical protein KGS72_28730 [Cyanobacteria bacterium REEB67]|nr:hypothetical protein [Cyanobacteria bacterium REEB67]